MDDKAQDEILRMTVINCQGCCEIIDPYNSYILVNGLTYHIKCLSMASDQGKIEAEEIIFDEVYPWGGMWDSDES